MNPRARSMQVSLAVLRLVIIIMGLKVLLISYVFPKGAFILIIEFHIPIPTELVLIGRGLHA
jgi:hypothetical protein